MGMFGSNDMHEMFRSPDEKLLSISLTPVGMLPTLPMPNRADGHRCITLWPMSPFGLLRMLNVEMLDTEMGLLITFAVNPIPQLWK